MKFRVIVKLKDGVLDPQGLAVKNAIHHLGYGLVKDVRVGKVVFIDTDGEDEKEIKHQIEQVADQLLANPVIEDFEVERLD